jgi:hypothetical protein
VCDEAVSCTSNYRGLWVKCRSKSCRAWLHAGCYGYRVCRQSSVVWVFCFTLNLTPLQHPV